MRLLALLNPKQNEKENRVTLSYNGDEKNNMKNIQCWNNKITNISYNQTTKEPIWCQYDSLDRFISDRGQKVILPLKGKICKFCFVF